MNGARQRDNRGRFVPIVEEIEHGMNLLLLIFRLIPYILLIYILSKYFKVQDIIYNQILEIACGTGCSCSCDKKNGFN